jgi:hypothetical protein
MVPAKPKIMDNSPDPELGGQRDYDPTSACYNQRCHYTIVISKSDGTKDEMYTTWTPTYRYENADPAIEYCFKVNCCNDCGESDYS